MAPHSTFTSQQDGLGLIPGWGDRVFLCGVCTFSLCSRAFPPGAPVSSHSPKMACSGELEMPKLPPRFECVSA